MGMCVRDDDDMSACSLVLCWQASIYKWWGHSWGLHPREHVTIMQGVVPVASGLSHMRYELPLHIVRDAAAVAAGQPGVGDDARSEL